MTRMSEICKTTMMEGFGFTDSELSQIEKFWIEQEGKTAKEILDNLIKNKRLRSKQKILISYFVGNCAAHQSQKISIKNSPIRDIEIDTPYFGG